MKEFFNTQIKPLNTELATQLGVNVIDVIYQSNPQLIKVRISYVSHAGNRVNRFAGQTSFYRSLGLMI